MDDGRSVAAERGWLTRQQELGAGCSAADLCELHIMCLYMYYVSIYAVVVVVDSHIQRIVLATEETTVTRQGSHRPIYILKKS